MRGRGCTVIKIAFKMSCQLRIHGMVGYFSNRWAFTVTLTIEY